MIEFNQPLPDGAQISKTYYTESHKDDIFGDWIKINDVTYQCMLDGYLYGGVTIEISLNGSVIKVISIDNFMG